jgi:calcium-dependent protein kinase
MGQTESNPSLLPNRNEQDGFIGIEKMTKRRKGNISIIGRYTTKRSVHDDYTFVMKDDKPKVLGTGMSGPVRLAQDKNGRQYAVKSFKKKKLNQQARDDLKREVEIYLSLDHPHIARLEQVYETEEEVHLVMEYMAGGELYERLASKKMYSEEAAAKALHQMLLAVAYLHAHNICHRDLKLENFLYESKDHSHLKLIDFGFSKIFSGGKQMSKACGSLHYVAPEVLAHAYTEKADMWSIGVMSHMLLTGSPVFRGRDDRSWPR